MTQASCCCRAERERERERKRERKCERKREREKERRAMIKVSCAGRVREQP